MMCRNLSGNTAENGEKCRDSSLIIRRIKFRDGRYQLSASTIYLHMAVMIGGGKLTKEETKKFWKD